MTSPTQMIKSKSHSINKLVTKVSSFKKFLSNQVQEATLSLWSQKSGKNKFYPSSVALATAPGCFGGISPNHSILKEPSFENTAIFMLKSPFLPHKDYTSLVMLSPSISTLWNHMVSLRHLDFSLLQNIDRDHASQSFITSTKVDICLVCTMFYNLDLASVICFKGGNYTAVHQDVNAITYRLTSPNYDAPLVVKIRHILTI